MRTVIIIVLGFILWAACVGIARYIIKSPSSTKPTIAFAVIWFLVAATNMWIGISEAEYTFMEELPIFFVIFLLPVFAGFIITKYINKRRASDA